MKALCSITLLLTVSALCYGQSTFVTSTGISGFYDYQVNYRTPQYIRVCPGTSQIHAIMMVADDSASVSTSRRTAYAYSTDGGSTWSTFNNLRVPTRRSGFPSLDILQGSFSNAAVVASHNTPTTVLQSLAYVDYPVGGGLFTELGAVPPLGSDEPIFPEIAGAADGSVVMIGSRAASGSPHRTRTNDLITWTPWSVITSEFISDGFVAEGNPTGRVGVAITAPGLPLQWLESTNNGATWPTSPTQLLPDLIPAGSDSYVITPGLDLVYGSSDTMIAFGATESVGGIATHRFSGIGFYSKRTGFVLAVPHDSIPGVVDTLRKAQVNQFPAGFPAIGMSGTNIVMTFHAFKPETSQVGFNYADVFFTYSSNGGRNWSRPRNLTSTTSLDERYPSISKWNASGQANIVFQEDTQPGSGAFGNDRAPVSRNSQRYCRVTNFTSSVSESNGRPSEFTLHQNYPNPFNPTTTIKFAVPHAADVTLKVFDVLGREVATLVDGRLQGGNYSKEFIPEGLASGVYVYQLRAGNYLKSLKLMLMR